MTDYPEHILADFCNHAGIPPCADPHSYCKVCIDIEDALEAGTYILPDPSKPDCRIVADMVAAKDAGAGYEVIAKEHDIKVSQAWRLINEYKSTVVGPPIPPVASAPIEIINSVSTNWSLLKRISDAAYKVALAKASYEPGAYDLLDSFQRQYAFEKAPLSQGHRFEVCHIDSGQTLPIDDAIYYTNIPEKYKVFQSREIINQIRRRGDRRCIILHQKAYNPLRRKRIYSNEYGFNILNLYRPCLIKPVAADVSIYLNHVRVLCGYDKIAYNHYINWASFIAQNPGVKIPQAVIISGNQGTGKSTLLKALEALIGDSNIRPVRIDDIGQRFNSFLRDCTLVAISETDRATDKVWDRLKEQISEDMQPIEGKGVDTVVTKTFSNFLLTTNSPQSLRLLQDDRRYFLAHSEVTKEKFEGTDYFTKLHNFLDSDQGRSGIRHFHLNHDISGFNQHEKPPETTAFKVYSQKHDRDWKCIADDMVSDILHNYKCFNRDALKAQLEEGIGIKIGPTKLGKFLSGLGLVCKMYRLDKGSSRSYYYAATKEDLALASIKNDDRRLVFEGKALGPSI